MKRAGLALVASIFLAVLGLAFPAQAAEVVGPTATFEVDCQDFDGVLRVTLAVPAENTEPVQFLIMENRSSYSPDPDTDPFTVVAPGASREIVVDGLPDGTRYIEVLVDDVAILPEQQYDVECDEIPTEPYSNPKATIYDVCESQAHVWASNRPIRGVTDLLQPVEFVVTETDSAGTTSELNRFTLPQEGSEDPYARELEYAFPVESGVHEVQVTANGQLIAQTPIDTGCEVVAQPVGGDDPAAVDDDVNLPATGLGGGLSVLLALGLALVAAGGAALRRGRVRVRRT